MAQRWHDLLFAHWPIDVESMRKLVPAGVEIDTFDGQAWVGVIPFRMSGVRLRFTPAVPWLSAFPELNVRTYVTKGGKAGVYFFSLDAGNPVAVAVARRWFYLPYFNAAMRPDEGSAGIQYSSRRTHRNTPGADFIGRYRPAGEVYRAEGGSLDHWLTERYCLYTNDPRGKLYRGEIHHSPWPLQPAEAEIETNTMALARGIALPQVAPVLHFARRLDVVVWPLQRLAF
jgi:hypothetical protein